MPAVRERRHPFPRADESPRIRRIIMVTIPCRAVQRGDTDKKPYEWAVSHQTHGVSTTCTAMSGNGAGTGTATIRRDPLPTRPVRPRERSVSFAAVPGSAARGACGPRVAAGTILTAGTTTTGSVLPGICSFTPYSFTPLSHEAACVQAARRRF